jgi:hypothetical protein
MHKLHNNANWVAMNCIAVYKFVKPYTLAVSEPTTLSSFGGDGDLYGNTALRQGINLLN